MLVSVAAGDASVDVGGMDTGVVGNELHPTNDNASHITPMTCRNNFWEIMVVSSFPV